MHAGERGARERVEDVFAAADRLTPEWIASLTLPARDMDRRAELLDDLEREAARHGRTALLDEARERLNDALSARSMLGAYTYARGGTIIRHAPAEDQARVLLALMDAVAVAVAEDLVRPADAVELSGPGRMLLGLPPVAVTPDAPTSLAPAGAPTEADWAAAAEGGAAAVDHDEPYRGGTALRRRFFLVTGAIAAVVALATGVAVGEALYGLLAAAAVAALAWTFATWRTPPDRP